MTLEPCDIFFTRSHSWLGWMIRTCTRAPGESRTWAQHVGMIAGAGEGMDAIAIEALTTVERHPLRDQYGDGKTELIVYRPINLTEDQRNKIIARANGYVGDRYGYSKIVLHLLDWCLGGRNVFRRLGRVDRWPICSFLVARCFQAADLTFGIEDEAASPDDLWDYCVTHFDKYQSVAKFPSY